MANGPKLSNIIVPNIKDELSILDRLEGILPTERERIAKAEIEAKQNVQLKQEALKLFVETEKGFTFLDQKVGLAERLGLDELVGAFRDKYDIEESKTERQILQDMQTAQDWREIVSGYERIKKNEDGFYFDSVDRIAGDAMNRFKNLDFINALNVEKRVKSDERTRVQKLLDVAAGEIDAYDNAILGGQDPKIGEEDKIERQKDLDRFSERLLLLEAEINNLDIQIKNPVIAGLNILNQERGQRRVEFQRSIGTNKMDSMMETDPGPVVESPDEEQSEDDFIQQVVDLEIAQSDVDDIPAVVERVEEPVEDLVIGDTTLGRGGAYPSIGDEISDLYRGAVRPLYEGQIRQKEELINSPFITEATKERYREEIENLKKLIEQ